MPSKYGFGNTRKKSPYKMGKAHYGKDMIKVDGKWKEAGDTGFPWEDDANNGTR